MINKLKQEIEEIENSVIAGMSKEDMYDLLVQAYSKATDVIALLESTAPVKVISADELALKDIELKDLTEDFNILSAQVKESQAKIDSLSGELTSLKLEYVEALTTLEHIRQLTE